MGENTMTENQADEVIKLLKEIKDETKKLLHLSRHQ